MTSHTVGNDIKLPQRHFGSAHAVLVLVANISRLRPGAYFDFAWHLLVRPMGRRTSRPSVQAIILQVDGLDPSRSPVLTKPLAVSAGGDPHIYEAFASTDDPGYLAILAWIQSGEFAE